MKFSIYNKLDYLQYVISKKIELFARNKREDWDAVGYELDGMDIYDSLNKIISK